MSMQVARGTFTVKLGPLVFEGQPEGAQLGRMSIDKDITGGSRRHDARTDVERDDGDAGLRRIRSHRARRRRIAGAAGDPSYSSTRASWIAARPVSSSPSCRIRARKNSRDWRALSGSTSPLARTAMNSRIRFPDSLLAGALLVAGAVQASAATPSYPAQVSRRDKEVIAAKACTGASSSGAERIDPTRRRKDSGTITASVQCLPHSTFGSLPLVHYTDCSNAGGACAAKRGMTPST